MPESISPYALLRASKPKPAPTVITPYDLYSAAQAHPYQPEQPAPPSAEPPVPRHDYAPARPLPRIPSGRTHYIADIHARHNQAMRRQPSSSNRHPPRS